MAERSRGRCIILQLLFYYLLSRHFKPEKTFGRHKYRSSDNMTSRGQNFTQSFHREPYPAISPTRPELSQAGRTVLVTGGSDGIGLAIAKAFLQGSAASVIIIGRRQNMIDKAIPQLGSQKSAGRVRTIGIACDMSDPVAAAKLGAGFGDQGIVIDVLVLNATSVATHSPILELGTEAVWKEYAMNARAQLDFAERFYKQPAKGAADTKARVQAPAP